MSKYSKLNLNTFALSCCIAACWCTLSSCVQKYSSWVLNTYTFIAQKVAIFAEKNSKTASLMFRQKVRFTENLKYSQSRDLQGIQWILWIYTDAAPDSGRRQVRCGTVFTLQGSPSTHTWLPWRSWRAPYLSMTYTAPFRHSTRVTSGTHRTRQPEPAETSVDDLIRAARIAEAAASATAAARPDASFNKAIMALSLLTEKLLKKTRRWNVRPISWRWSSLKQRHSLAVMIPAVITVWKYYGCMQDD